MAWIVAGVRNQQVNQKFFSVIVVPELSDDLTRFYRLFRITGSRFSPASVIWYVTCGPVRYSPESHRFHGGELWLRQEFLGRTLHNMRDIREINLNSWPSLCYLGLLPWLPVCPACTRGEGKAAIGLDTCGIPPWHP